MSEMTAVLYDRYGPPEVLYTGRVPRPAAGPGELLVRVHAASVNGGETLARSGRTSFVTGRGWPKRMGIDFAGEVAGLGSGVHEYAIGDRVWGVLSGWPPFGTAAEYVTVLPKKVSRAPANVDLVDAAALPVVGITALTGLRDRAGLARGERLLVRGASGGLGSVAVQLGRAYGAHVSALAGSDHLDFVRGLGAHEAHDYRAVRPDDLGRYDVIYDTVGTELGAWRRLLAPGGRMVAASFDIDRMFRSLSGILLSGVHGARRIRFFRGDDTHPQFAELARLTESGAIRPVVGSVRPLAEAGDAHRALEAGGVRGKHVLRVV